MKKILIAALVLFSVLSNSITTLAFDEESTMLGAFSASFGFKADFSVNTQTKNYQIKIKNIEEELNIKVQNGRVFVNDNTSASAVCTALSQWYITANKGSDSYNIVLDGISIATGAMNIESGETAIYVTGADANLRAFGEVNSDAQVNVTSDKLTIGNGYITGIANNSTAADVTSLIDASADATVVIYTENGFVRTGKIRAGDVVRVLDRHANVVCEYALPDVELNYLTSDIFEVNTSNMTIDGVYEGLSAEQIAGSLKSKSPLTARLKDRKTLTLTIAGQDYDFLLKNTPPKEAVVFNECFENGEQYNYFSASGVTEQVYSDEAHGNSMALYPNNSNTTFRRIIAPIDYPIVYSQSVKYKFPENHKRYFHAPYLRSTGGREIQIKERRDSLGVQTITYNDVTNDSSVERKPDGLVSESDRWYDIDLFIKPEEHQYDIYIDDNVIGTANMYSDMNDIAEMNYGFSSANGSIEESGEMYIDDVYLFTPYVQITLMEFYDGTYSSYNSEELTSCDKIELTFANKEYNKISTSDIGKAITITDESGNPVEYTGTIIGDTFMSIIFTEPLSQGSYKLNITNAKTIHNEATVLNRSYNIYINKQDSGIEYAEVKTDGIKAYAEVGFYDKAELAGKVLILASYTADGKLCGVKYQQIAEEGISELIECTADVSVSAAKLFIWNSLDKLTPIGATYNKNFD